MTFSPESKSGKGAYYNENDPKAAAWLKELIRQGHIADGDVDERSICDVKPDDLEGYVQCHFFGGIGGWSLALRLAGWPDDEPVWTGSCPCQPFSAAGKRKGTSDARHLWPEFRRLIAECHPAIVFGEQVASKDGREWLDGVRADLEGLVYAVGAADLCAAGAGSPNIRQRLWWVADADRERFSRGGQSNGIAIKSEQQAPRRNYAGGCGSNGGLEHSKGNGREQRRAEPIGRGVGARCGTGRLADRFGTRLEIDSLQQARPQCQASERSGKTGFWSNFAFIPCRDKKRRRVEPGTFPLAHGLPARVGRLRGYGNAIIPQVAAEFIKAFEEARGLTPIPPRTK